MTLLSAALALCLFSLALARQPPTSPATALSLPLKVSMVSFQPVRSPAYSTESHSSTPAVAPAYSGESHSSSTPARAPTYFTERHSSKHSPSPAYSPKNHGHSPRSHMSKHHKRIHHSAPPPSFTSALNPVGCDVVSCTDPMTSTPIGSPCGCVRPMQVELDLAVAPYQLFSSIGELEVQVAAGTYLKQSQVRIMGASASIRNPGKTTVNIDLVPLGEKLDSMSAFLTYERFWQKKIPINMTIFGDYDVIYVKYPGLPSPPSTSLGEFLGPSEFGSHQYPLTANVSRKKTEKMNPGIVAAIAFSSSVIVMMCFGAVYIFRRYKTIPRASAAIGPTFTSSLTRRTGNRSIMSSSTASSMSVSFISTIAPCASTVRKFSIEELEKATDKFSSKKVLGEGGFGRVYLGIMGDGTEVAIKLLTREDRGDREFIAEVEMLSRLHHRNLVKLIGICMEGHRRCLVYELIRNGSVESHLHGADRLKAPLDWDTRMKIALGAARGLAYLHEDSNPRVIHRDFKASNVLLEEDFTPKVSDFGLAREASEGIHHISTRVMGTFGYVAPEYAMTGHLLVKSDVYSYGVVLLELLSGRKPVDISQPHGSENLVNWARPLLTTREGLKQLVDPSLGPDYDFDTMAKVAAIASLCVHTEASQRPFMGEVVQALKLIYKYNDMDDNCEDSCSQMESTSGGADCGDGCALSPEGGWWSGSCSPRYAYNCTMEYSSGCIEEREGTQSESLAGGHNRSGPLRKVRNKSNFYRLRGSVSEHGHSQSRRSWHAGCLV